MGRTLRTTIGLVAVFAFAFAGTAVASHVYNDVPSSSVFHREIAEIGEAGCAEGFAGGLFKPNDPVKRQQMARFLSRCGSRVAHDDGSITRTQQGFDTIVDVNLTNFANGFAVVTATGSAFTDAENLCPCRVAWRLFDESVSNSINARGQVPNTAADDGEAFEPMSITYVFPVGKGSTSTFRLEGTFADADLTSMTFEAELTAVFVPFEGNVSL